MHDQKVKDRFPEILAEHLGIVTNACKAAGIGRRTYYNWREEDPEFAKACDDVSEQTIDFVESKLLENIRDGKEASQIFYLKTKAKHRGYVERTEHTGADGGPLRAERSPEEVAREIMFGFRLVEDRKAIESRSTDTPSDVLPVQDAEIIEQD